MTEADKIVQALVLAKNESNLFPELVKSVSGIVFLGTPHQGSRTADYATTLSRIPNAIMTGSQLSRFTGSVLSQLCETLKANSEGLLHLAQDFRVQTSSINITSCIEQNTMKGLNELVGKCDPIDLSG